MNDIDHLDWKYEPDGPGPQPWTPLSCFTVTLIVLAFWLVVIGGGLWLADNRPFGG